MNEANKSAAVEIGATALTEFGNWYAHNYPAQTMLFNPSWHAKRIFRAAADRLIRRIHEDAYVIENLSRTLAMVHVELDQLTSPALKPHYRDLPSIAQVLMLELALHRAVEREARGTPPDEITPLHHLGRRLAELLDEDQFANCTAILLRAAPRLADRITAQPSAPAAWEWRDTGPLETGDAQP